MIKFNGYPFLEKEDHAFNVPGLCLSPHWLRLIAETYSLASRESDETRLAYSSSFWYDSRFRSAAEQHGSEWVPDCHERCSPNAGRIHWAAGSAVRNRYVFDNPHLEVMG